MENDISIPVDANVYLTTDTEAPNDWHSETTSVGSTIREGVLENGRIYQTLREDQIHLPSDDQMFEVYETAYLLMIICDSDSENPLYQAPTGKSPKHILDIGTGKGSWAIDVSDLFPSATVRGVDVFPPPVDWLPPNCIFEVDDILKDWTWKEPFDLVHISKLDGSFSVSEQDFLYKQCYEHLKPGGWIEQIELSGHIECDDNSLSEDNILRSWGPRLAMAANKAGRPLGTMYTMRDSIERAGFEEIHVEDHKIPIGPWAKDNHLKELGVVNHKFWNSGLEGFGMWLLTRFGDPEPWSREKVIVYVAHMRQELLKTSVHAYSRSRRIWARKPLNEERVEPGPAIKTEPSP